MTFHKVNLQNEHQKLSNIQHNGKLTAQENKRSHKTRILAELRKEGEK